jgi:hypothetical protein
VSGTPQPCGACGSDTLSTCVCGAWMCGSYNPGCVGHEAGCPACGLSVTDDPERPERNRRRPGETHEEWIVRRACTDKAAWDRGRDAAQVALGFNGRLPPGGKRYYYYDCRYCRRFHLTRQTPEEQARRRAWHDAQQGRRGA